MHKTSSTPQSHKSNTSSSSGSATPTAPISFAQAAQKNTTKSAQPPAPVAAATTTGQVVPPAAAASSTTTPSTTSSTTSAPAAKPASTPAAAVPASTTTNGNYSSVAAGQKGNAQKKAAHGPQAPSAASNIKAQAGKINPHSGSTGSSIQFGSFNQAPSGTASASAPVTAAAPASPANTTPATVVASSTPAEKEQQAPTHTPDNNGVPKQVNHHQQPSHIPQQHLAHSHHPGSTHRRTDSASSSHSNDPNHPQFGHFHGQPQPISQSPGMQAGPPSFTSQRPPVNKGQPGQMGVNPQAQHHGGNPMPHNMVPQQQWAAPPYYIPQYDQGQYYQPQMYQPNMYNPQRQSIPTPSRFNPAAASFQPQAPVSKRIAIINPDTKTEVTPLPSATTASTPADTKVTKPVVIDMKRPEDEKKDIITPPPAKKIINIVNPAVREKEEKERKEKEEAERKAKEEAELKAKEEAERIAREAKEAEERKAKEEAERLAAIARAELEAKEKAEREAREAEERKAKEEAERLAAIALAEKEAKEKAEREAREAEEKARLEKERIAKEEAEEKARLEKERIAKEEADKARAEKEKADREAKEAEERKVKEEAEQKAKEETAKAEEAKRAAETAAAAAAAAPAPAKAGMSIDLNRTVSAPAPGTSTRIDNFGAVDYPSHIQSPNDPQGKFKYGRDFLMQFMSLCTDKPTSLPSLEALGMDENDRRSQAPSSRGGRGNSNQRMGSFGVGRPGVIGMQANGLQGMPIGGRSLSNDMNRMGGRTNSDSGFMPRNGPLSRPPSQRGSRGGKKGGMGGRGGGGDHHHNNNNNANLTIPLDQIVPLEKTDNAWTPAVGVKVAPTAVAADELMSQEVVQRKVKGLLNKLTLEKFESISDKVIEIANQSSKEEDGTTLKHCIQLVFEKATDEPNFGSVYAQLCRKMMDKVAADVKDINVKSNKGDFILGGNLFRKYLLNRCQEEFSKGWKEKASAGGVSLNDKDGPDLMSDEYYVLMKAKRQGLGVIHFIGEMFKLNMLTERIMHDCVKKLLANVKEPEEEETEGLCKLMTTIGLQLDRPEAKAHMDIYFSRMADLTKSPKLASRIRFMVQDVIDLRANHWVNRRAAAGPKTISEIHQEAAKQAEEKEMQRVRAASSGGGRLPNRREQMSRGPSFRGPGDARHDMNGGVPPVGADGWSTVGNNSNPATKRAGDLSAFGKTNRTKVSGAPTLGPAGNVFGSLKPRSAEKAAQHTESPRGSAISSTNIFAALEGDGGDRRGSVDAEKPVERRRLNLLPRTAPVAEGGDETASPAVAKAEEAPAGPKMSEDEAKRRIGNTLKEYFSVKDMSEVVTSIKELEPVYRSLAVTEFVNDAMERKQSEVDAICTIFKKLTEENALTKENFEAGFADPLEFLADTAIDVPNAYKYAAQLLEAAGLDPAKAKAE